MRKSGSAAGFGTPGPAVRLDPKSRGSPFWFVEESRRVGQSFKKPWVVTRALRKARWAAGRHGRPLRHWHHRRRRSHARQRAHSRGHRRQCRAHAHAGSAGPRRSGRDRGAADPAEAAMQICCSAGVVPGSVPPDSFDFHALSVFSASLKERPTAERAEWCGFCGEHPTVSFVFSPLFQYRHVCISALS